MHIFIVQPQINRVAATHNSLSHPNASVDASAHLYPCIMSFKLHKSAHSKYFILYIYSPLSKFTNIFCLSLVSNCNSQVYKFFISNVFLYKHTHIYLYIISLLSFMLCNAI